MAAKSKRHSELRTPSNTSPLSAGNENKPDQVMVSSSVAAGGVHRKNLHLPSSAIP
jgi:hypothetical protein